MPAATTSTGTPTPSAGSTETPTKSGIDGAGQPAATATDRGWDGWPTPPTQEYLIPGMGKVPVSSTVHFQTVAMTAMGDDISAEQLRELRSRLLFAAQGRPNRRWALDNTGRVTVTTVPVLEFEESQLEGLVKELRDNTESFAAWTKRWLEDASEGDRRAYEEVLHDLRRKEKAAASDPSKPVQIALRDSQRALIMLMGRLKWEPRQE